MPKLHPYKTMPLKEAIANDYYPLTEPCMPAEYPLMEAAIASLKKGPGHIAYVIVAEDEKRPNDLCVYRKGHSL